MRDPGSIPRGVHMWNWDSPVSIVSLHWWLRRDLYVWPCLRWALSRTVTRPLCRQCDNPTWSHTALLSRSHAHCRSSFRLHNRHCRLLGGALWTAWSHFIHTQSHWSSGSTRHEGPRFNPRGGVLMWNWDSPVGIVSLQHLIYSRPISNAWQGPLI
jgi:hypothetical protein